MRLLKKNKNTLNSMLIEIENKKNYIVENNRIVNLDRMERVSYDLKKNC